MTTNDQTCLKIAVALPVKGTYSYTLPKSLESQAKIGCRVTVPFGNRKITGYILEKLPKDNDYALKKILDVLDPEPLFPETLVPFFEWLSQYYIHPIGQLIKSALPGGINENFYKTAVLTQKGLDALDRLPYHYEDIQIFSWIKKNTGKRLPWPLSRVESLQKKGWLVIKDRTYKKQTGHLMRRFVTLRKGIDLQDVITEKTLKSRNEFEFLKTISRSEKIFLNDLKATYSNSSYLIKKWAEKGVIDIGTMAVMRNPAGEILASSPVPVELYEQQKRALRDIQKGLDKGSFSSCLLYGVTGSGKTEVYFRAVEHALQLGKQAIILVPEIALAFYMEGIFRSRMGNRIAIYHSGLSRGERYDQWMRIARGDADLVIGARSALFAPLSKLGLIIVDEEHDTAYKQDTSPRYQARDAAVVRAKVEKAFLILGSGTPSIQSFQNSIAGRYRLLSMPERVEKRPLPDVEIIDMKPTENKRPGNEILSPKLKKAIEENLMSGNQTLLFLNRRGFHRLYICRFCGQPVRCPNCDVVLTHHLKENRLICHYCGYYSVTQIRCPTCGHIRLRPYGFGTEKLEQDLVALFPNARIARMDTDSTRRKGDAFKILRRFSEHRIDILVGTQMITKGYDFPLVTLVGVIAADMSLGFPDFRAGERTFQILSQVAGRAGRGSQGGKVIIQTFNPNHYAITAATEHDFQLFFEKEKELREQLGYPPFSHLASLRLKGNNRTKTEEAAQNVARNIKGILRNWPKRGTEFQVLGPVEAPISRLKGKYRMQILIKSKSVSALQHLLHEVDSLSKRPLQSHGVHLIVDVDPYQMI